MTAPPARQQIAPGELPRHRHAEPYVALVLAGGYEEAGDNGRRQVRAGDVIVHQAWEAHLNRTPGRGARVLNLPAAVGLAPFGHVDDPDTIASLHEHDPIEASVALCKQFCPNAPALDADWPEILAAGLVDPAGAGLGHWADALGIRPEHLSRRFTRLYGVGPQRFRWEARTRAAWRDVVGTSVALAQVALAHGFADQAHMTRSIHLLTGRPPGAWRRSNPFKTAA
jgi:AraC-like DNA-binding protein